jgi:hypothetical protein
LDQPFLNDHPEIHCIGKDLHDFSALAALMENLDLIFGVNTSFVHLAGAIRRPVYSLLPLVADWRWLIGRSDSPWYPTALLFRQQVAGDWSGVMQRVVEQLRASPGLTGI